LIENVIEGVKWIPGRDRFMPDSHMYVIGKPEFQDYTLVDCGLMELGEYKIAELQKGGIPLDEVKRVIMTHTHLDHIGCLPELIKAMPHLEVWMHEDEASRIIKGDDSIVFGNSMFRSMVVSQYNVPKDHFKIEVARSLKDNEMLSLGGLEFRVIHIPGHSIGSIGLYNETDRLFMSGDTIYADGAIGRYDLESADPAQLKQSLERIGELGISILLPCHNRIVRSGAEDMIKDTVKQWAPYLTS
jgi:glyoxylase-like metal-dependent hydrolase (beta-lactamase superfamily II)